MRLVNEANIDYGRIIVGLTTWTRSYIFSQKIIEASKAALSLKNISKKIGILDVNKTSLTSLTGFEMKKFKIYEEDLDIGHGSTAISVGVGGSTTRRTDGRFSFYEVLVKKLFYKTIN